MTFLGKLAYLALFPGLAFILVAGTVARGARGAMSRALYGGNASGPPFSLNWLAGSLLSLTVAADGSLHAVSWLAPMVRLVSLSWAACVLCRFLPGDLPLLFALLLLALSADLLVTAVSANPRVRQQAVGQGFALACWAAPLAFAFATVALRTGELSVQGVLTWQAQRGVLVAAGGAGPLAIAGSALAFAAVLLLSPFLMGLRPWGRDRLAGPPDGGTAADLSGAPLALSSMGDSALLVVAPLVLVALFLAGPSSTWYDVIFWVLKVAGMFLVLAVADLVFPRLTQSRAALWMLGAGGVLALAGLALVWAGVAR